LYGWTDERMSKIAGGIWRCTNNDENPTAADYFDIYQLAKDHIDPLLTVKERKHKGDKSIPAEMYIAAVCCSVCSLPIDKIIETFNDFTEHNESGKIWNELRTWQSYYSPEREPGQILRRVAVRFSVMKSFIKGEKIRKIQNIEIDEISSISNECKDNLRRICLMEEK